MECHDCRVQCRKYGMRNGVQRYQCCQCKRILSEARERFFDSMYTAQDRGLTALHMLLEGNSIRSTERLSNLHRDTILRLLVVA